VVARKNRNETQVRLLSGEGTSALPEKISADRGRPVVLTAWSSLMCTGEAEVSGQVHAFPNRLEFLGGVGMQLGMTRTVVVEQFRVGSADGVAGVVAVKVNDRVCWCPS
jgi:hypothetical protein